MFGCVDLQLKNKIRVQRYLKDQQGFQGTSFCESKLPLSNANKYSSLFIYSELRPTGRPNVTDKTQNYGLMLHEWTSGSPSFPSLVPFLPSLFFILRMGNNGLTLGLQTIPCWVFSGTTFMVYMFASFGIRSVDCSLERFICWLSRLCNSKVCKSITFWTKSRIIKGIISVTDGISLDD